MRRAHLLLAWVVCLMLALTGIMARPAFAAPASQSFVIDDAANLLTKSQETKLRNDYTELTEYVDTAFVSVASNSSSTDKFARSYVNREFGSRAAVIFVIDMDNREIYVYANQAGLSLISRADARAITDNIYKLASKGDYYACADAAFSQILVKCQGGRIARPVKHITNALIAIVLGVLGTFFYTMYTRSRLARAGKKQRDAARLEAMPELVLSHPVVTRTERHYKSKSHGGGGGGGSGGGGGGGGHGF
ncbi:MAG: TPM domain-containing protein [Atopobiaceae bacterium]|nr:TPM domain-containing protein [Atopobiaceae bacterium]